MDSKYKPTIGLEIHAELRTATKMFCSCKNDPDEVLPNVNVCPVCMAHPGALPVINKEAVKSVLKVGLAVRGKLAGLTEFDRKNYFYPDIPKGYQISQYKNPLVLGGELADVRITRIHLEEDTGTSVHSEDKSLVNFNRAGVPLMELVTEPDIHSGEEASRFAKELQLLLQYLGVAEANMEKGEMRVEVNISVAQDTKGAPLPFGSGKGAPLVSVLGTKVEIKNLNSFKSAERAIEYEIKRQAEVLERGEKVVQETRGWNEVKQETYSQRIKEDSHDYRYFPDPDLPKLDISKIPEFNTEALRGELPEVPEEKRQRLASNFGIKETDIEFYISNKTLSDFFESVVKVGESSFNQLASNYIVSDLASRASSLSGLGKITASHFTWLLRLVIENKISSRGAKDILIKMFESDVSPAEIAKENNLLQILDEATVEKIVEEIISQNKNIVEEYKKGKTSALQFLVGQGMKLSKGSGNPSLLRKILEQKLS